VSKGRTSVVVSVRLPDDLVKAAKAEIKGRQSFSELVRTLLVGYLVGWRSLSDADSCSVSENWGLGSAWDGLATERPVEATFDAARDFSVPSPETKHEGDVARDDGSDMVKRYVAINGEPRGHHRCPCGSGHKWRDCHGQKLPEFRS
jgi:hypothetical protein